jgi:hypothetical protein
MLGNVLWLGFDAELTKLDDQIWHGYCRNISPGADRTNPQWVHILSPASSLIEGCGEAQ